MEWQEVAVTVREPCVESIAGLFYMWGAGGLAIEDPVQIKNYVDQGIWDAHGFSEDFLCRDEVVIRAYFPASEVIGPEMIAALKAAGGPGCVVRISLAKEEGWAENWKNYYHVTHLGSRFVVVPSWESYEQQAHELVITIDPGMAFGTGTHATTRQCLELLEQVIAGREKVIDVGTGSGILAIAAALLGAGEVTAIDNDPVAVRIALENIKLNGQDDKVKTALKDLSELEGQAFDVVIANLTGYILYRFRRQLFRILASGGYLIMAGINEFSWPQLQQALKQEDIIVRKILREEDWIAVLARRS